MQSLTPCPSCRRHVMTREVACPFCSADLLGHMASLPTRPLPRTKLGRSALFVFGATAALSASTLVGCSDDGHDPKGKPRDASTDASNDARAASIPDAAPALPSDASSITDARASTTPDAGDAGPLRPADAGTQQDGGEDAGDDFGIPIYALVAPPQKAPDTQNGLPAYAGPDSRHRQGTSAPDVVRDAPSDDESALT